MSRYYFLPKASNLSWELDGGHTGRMGSVGFRGTLGTGQLCPLCKTTHALPTPAAISLTSNVCICVCGHVHPRTIICIILFNPNLKIQPKPPKCPLYTDLRGLMGPRKTRPGRKQPSRRQTQQLLFWACGRINRLSRKPCWMKATASLHVPVEHRGRFCTLLIYICLLAPAVRASV